MYRVYLFLNNMDFTRIFNKYHTILPDKTQVTNII